ncbi:sodium-dependent bicarbonate transport family permease [Microvirga roseola]|uniref:sodium-dependent bicarbonate transport family permease n=1 Tax=Microvirga roseola TaxID=2883126 RepID=UPI001E5C3933|nr:sodium-dependent bicarbonate transport family permease [Microvirga roseola]
MNLFELAAQNLLSPMVLFFALGLAAALARSDLTVPEAVAKTLALYLMLAIGFKGGAEVAAGGVTLQMIGVMGVGIVLSFLIPVIGFALLRAFSRLSTVDAAAVAAHYGSISIVTFIAATEIVRGQGLPFEGYIVAVAAVMETPAILSALLLARSGQKAKPGREGLGPLLHEVGLNGSVVMLVGSFLIGWATGAKGLATIAPFIVDPFRGVLCLFLLDMGLVAGRGMREGARHLSPPVLGFGIVMPLISAALATLAIWPLGLSPGGAALFITLAASASYIAVPAAMRLALPEARPAIYLTLSLGVTFPFNLSLGIPLYLALAGLAAG